MKKIFSINVQGRHGYSFAVKCDTSYNEDTVIELARESALFDDDEDADYATAEDITESDYDIEHLQDCTYEL